jgi:UDP-N-acetyl-L-fucosamine synthase
MKVVTVIGTRPEIIKLSRIIPVLDRYLDQKIIHTDQNYDFELNQIFFDDLAIRKPDHILNPAMIRAGVMATATEVTCNIMTRLDNLLGRLQPDALLILGDTNSCFGAAYVAKRRKIPVFHMEAGNRCYDDRVPEEINRRIIDHICDVNMPYSSIARECLVREGIPTDRIIKTGSPMYEVLEYYKAKITSSNILQKLGLEPHKYFVVSCHREENIDYKFDAFIALLNQLAEKYHQRIIVSTHPRTRRQIDSRKLQLAPEVEFLKPFGFCDYVNLQMNARLTLSDSGTITEESSIMGFPALNLRETHERHEGMEEGSVPLVGFNLDRIFECIPIVEEQKGLQIPVDYCTPNVSDKVLRIILSYTDYINRTVWRA